MGNVGWLIFVFPLFQRKKEGRRKRRSRRFSSAPRWFTQSRRGRGSSITSIVISSILTVWCRPRGFIFFFFLGWMDGWRGEGLSELCGVLLLFGVWTFSFFFFFFCRLMFPCRGKRWIWCAACTSSRPTADRRQLLWVFSRCFRSHSGEIWWKETSPVALMFCFFLGCFCSFFFFFF